MWSEKTSRIMQIMQNNIGNGDKLALNLVWLKQIAIFQTNLPPNLFRTGPKKNELYNNFFSSLQVERFREPDKVNKWVYSIMSWNEVCTITRIPSNKKWYMSIGDND